jgi:hypothetical protein
MVLILYGGCGNPFEPSKSGNGSETEQERQAKDFSTIEHVLYNFTLAWELRDIHMYAQCLDDNYEFHFNPADVEEIGAPYWTREEDLEYTEKLFEAGIDFEYALSGTFQEIDDNSSLHPGEDWYICKRYLSARFIYDLDGELQDVSVHGWINFYLREAAQDSISIIRIEDLTGG